MSTLSFKRFLPCISLVSRFCANIFPNATAHGKKFTIAQQMAQKPYQRIYNPEPSLQLPSLHRNLLLDERSGRRGGYVRPHVTRRLSKTCKPSDSLVIRRNRRSRTVFTNEQVAELECYFMHSNYVNSERAEELATKLCLDAAPVKCWFKNHRRRIKVKESGEQIANESHGAITSEVPKLQHKGLIILSPTPPPTPPSSIIEVSTPYSANLSYYNQITFDTKLAPAVHPLHHVATSTPTQFDQNVAIPLQYTQQLSYQQQQTTADHVAEGTSYQDPRISLSSMSHRNRNPPAADDLHSLTPVSNTSDTSDYFSQMSPNSELCEPLTPSSVHSEAESVFNDILDSLKTPNTPHTIENIYEKLLSAPEPNFNNGRNTMFHSHDTHHNPAVSSPLLHTL